MKLSVQKSLRFTQEEWKQLDFKLTENGIKFSQFARAAIFRRKFVTSIDRGKLYQLQRIGNNLNQIAKVCNINKTIDKIVLLQLKELKNDIQKVLK